MKKINLLQKKKKKNLLEKNEKKRKINFFLNLDLIRSN